MTGIVVLKQKNIYEVKINEEIFISEISGNIKNSFNHPIVGDIVELEKMIDNKRLMIKKVQERKNKLIRPLVANVDQAIIVNAIKQPELSTYLIDKMLAIIEYQNIEPIILITKKDLIHHYDNKFKIIINSYRDNGYKIFFISNKTKEGFEELKDQLKNKLTVITGQSGVGKSTTLNTLNNNLHLETQEISLSLNRGKHTTRFNKIYEIFKNSYLIDTPGFSSLEIPLTQYDLSMSYHDFKEHKRKCKFNNCLHNSEPECEIKNMVKNKKISKMRYDNYIKLLREIKDE